MSSVQMQVCLFCGGDASEPDHVRRCDGRQGRIQGMPPFNPRALESLVRPTDPETSFEAADAIEPHLRLLQERVLQLFHDFGPMTQHALIDLYRERHGHAPESTIRTRCAELVEVGLIADTGARRLLPSGRRAVIWQRTVNAWSEAVGL